MLLLINPETKKIEMYEFVANVAPEKGIRFEDVKQIVLKLCQEMGLLVCRIHDNNEWDIPYHVVYTMIGEAIYHMPCPNVQLSTLYKSDYQAPEEVCKTVDQYSKDNSNIHVKEYQENLPVLFMAAILKEYITIRKVKDAQCVINANNGMAGSYYESLRHFAANSTMYFNTLNGVSEHIQLFSDFTR